MKPINFIKKNLLTVGIFLTILFCFVMILKAGNPVNGGEIYIELEPDDEPIACCSGGTNTNGQYFLALPQPLMQKILARSNPSAKLKPYTLSVYFKLPASIFENELAKLNPTDLSKGIKFSFPYNIKNGSRAASGNFTVSINSQSEIASKISQRFGPFKIILDNPNDPNVNITLQCGGPISIGSKTSKNPL